MKQILLTKKHKLLIYLVLTTIMLAAFSFLFIRNNLLAEEPPVTKKESVQRVNLNSVPKFLISIGDEKLLNQPMGVVTDSEGNIYVADSGNSDIKVFSPEGEFLYSFKEKDDDKTNLNYPYGLLFLPDGNLLVGDTSKHTVDIYSKDGKYLKQFISAKKNIKPGGFYQDAAGNLYIVDLSQNQIIVYDSKGKEKESIKSSEFNFVQGVIKDRNSNLIVANSGLNEILFLSPKGQLIKEITGESQSYPRFTMIRGMTVDSLNRLIIVDTLINRIRFFSPKGEELFFIDSVDDQVSNLQFPMAVHTTPEGKIFVVDRGNNRVLVWIISE